MLQFYGHLLQIYGFEPTVLWSPATEIWCHPQAPGLVATNLWFLAFSLPWGPFCYRFMVVDPPRDLATDLWSWPSLGILLQIYGRGHPALTRLH